MPARQFASALQQGVRRRYVAVSEELLQRALVQRARHIRMAGESRKLAGEGKQPALGGVVQRLFAKPVAGTEEAALPTIVNRESEHAVEFQRQFLAPFLPAMDQDLGIRMMRGKPVAAADKLLT